MPDKKIDIVERIEKWNIERNLHKKPFVLEDELTNIVEEIYEMFEVNELEPRSRARGDVKNFIYNITEVWSGSYDNTEKILDAFADIIVYSVGAILKLKYCPKCIMEEVLKEIESRKGKYNEKTGKWEKEKSNKKIYVADFNKCKK